MSLRTRVGSVRVRVTVLATAVVAVALVIGSIALFGLGRHALLRTQSGAAAQRAEAIEALAVDGVLPDPLPALDAPRLTLVQVVSADGTVIASSQQLAGRSPVTEPDQRRRRVVHDIDGLGGGPWLAEVADATIGAKPVTVIVVTSVAEYARSAELLRHSLLITVPVLVLLVAVVVWLVVGRALRPVEAMRTEVENITGHKLERRVPKPRSTDEVGRLANTLNDMLDRLQASSEAQRRFVADASHELRTPIANIRMAVEVASAHPERADWSSVADDVLHQDARMQRLTDDLLLLARAEAAPSVREVAPVDIAELVATELRRPVPGDRALTAPIDSAASSPPVMVLGDADQLGRMLTNLVDNALRHANRDVSVGYRLLAERGDGRTVEITVSDDGPGIPTADREIVFDPFVRLDQHRARNQGGTGLGLSIVHRVVLAHHGTVRVADSERGATFIVNLPAAPTGPPRFPG